MKISIVTAVLDSHEIVRRQLEHYGKMNLPEDVEIIFADDGSIPPLRNYNYLDNDGYFEDILFNFSIYPTGFTANWTQPAARNLAASHAIGEYLIVTDIDHIISRKLIETVRNCTFDVLRFKRQAGILDEDGNFTQEDSKLREWGLLSKWHLNLPPHSNSFAIKRELFNSIGGMSERYHGRGQYPNREEIPVKRKLKALEAEGKITICQDDRRPRIYMFPNGRYCGDQDCNPFGFFHNLSRKTNKDKRRATT